MGLATVSDQRLRRNAASKRGSDGLLRLADRHGASPAILFQGNPKSSSKYGGVVTVLEFLLKAAGLMFILYNFFKRYSPETNINRLYVRDPEGFYLDNSSLPFTFGLQNRSRSHFIDEQVYVPVATYVQYTRNLDSEPRAISRKTVNLTAVRCSELGLHPEQFSALPLEHLYCIKEMTDPQSVLRITGAAEDSQVYGYLDIKIRSCIGSGCKPPAEIKKALATSYFGFSLLNSAAKPSNYSSPVEKLLTSYFTATSTGFVKHIQLKLLNNEVRTFSSLLGFAPPSLCEFVSADSFLSDVAQVGAPGEQLPVLATLTLKMDSSKQQVDRSYQTLFQYVSELAGLAQVLSVLALAVTGRYARLSMLLDMKSELSRRQRQQFEDQKQYSQGRPPAAPSERKQSPFASDQLARFCSERRISTAGVDCGRQNIREAVPAEAENQAGTSRASQEASPGLERPEPPGFPRSLLAEPSGQALPRNSPKQSGAINHAFAVKPPKSSSQLKYQRKFKPGNFILLKESKQPGKQPGKFSILSNRLEKPSAVSDEETFSTQFSPKKPGRRSHRTDQEDPVLGAAECTDFLSLFCECFVPFLTSSTSKTKLALREAAQTMADSLELFELIQTVRDVRKLRGLLFSQGLLSDDAPKMCETARRESPESAAPGRFDQKQPFLLQNTRKAAQPAQIANLNQQRTLGIIRSSPRKDAALEPANGLPVQEEKVQPTPNKRFGADLS